MISKDGAWILYGEPGGIGRSIIFERPYDRGGRWQADQRWIFVAAKDSGCFVGRTRAEAVLRFRIAHPGEKLYRYGGNVTARSVKELFSSLIEEHDA